MGIIHFRDVFTFGRAKRSGSDKEYVNTFLMSEIACVAGSRAFYIKPTAPATKNMSENDIITEWYVEVIFSLSYHGEKRFLPPNM